MRSAHRLATTPVTVLSWMDRQARSNVTGDVDQPDVDVGRGSGFQRHRHSAFVRRQREAGVWRCITQCAELAAGAIEPVN